MFMFFFLIVYKNILTIALLTRNTRLIQALAIPTGLPMIVLNEQGETTRLVCIVECCAILIERIAHLFSVINLSNGIC